MKQQIETDMSADDYQVFERIATALERIGMELKRMNDGERIHANEFEDEI